MRKDFNSNDSVRETGGMPFHQTWMTVVYDEKLNMVDIINPQHNMLLQLTTDSLLHTNLSELEKITDESNRKSAEVIVRSIRKAWEENRSVYFEYTTTQQDGTVTYSICYAEKRPDGLLYVDVIKIDEENIFEARDGFTNYILDSTMNNVSVGVCMRQVYEDGTWKYILFNDVVKEFYECGEVVHSPFWNQEEDDEADRKAMLLDEPLKTERVIRDAQGDVKRWLIVTKKRISNRIKGHYIVTTFIDITRRRQNEIMLGKQLSLLDSMYRCLPEAIIIYNEEGRLISLNDKGLELFGIADRELVMGTDLFLDPNTTPESKKALKRGEDVNYEVEYDFDLVSNKYMHTSRKGKRLFRVKAAPIRSTEGVLNGYLEVYEDITEQRAVEDALMNKHRLLETVFENVPVGLEIYDKAGRLIDINKQEMNNLGIDNVAMVMGTKLDENPNLPEEVKASIRQKEKFAVTIDYDFQLAGRIIGDTVHSGHHYFRVLSTPINGGDGSYDGYLFVNQDVTKQVKHEQLLVATVAKFSTIFNSMACGIEIYNREGKLVDCNPYDLEIFGIDRKEDFLEAGITLFNNPNVGITERELLGGGSELIKNVEYSFDVIRSTGYYSTRKTGFINLEIKINLILSEGEDFLGFVVVMNDTTELRHRERQLEQTQNNLTMALEASDMSVWRYAKYKHMFTTILGDTLSGTGMTMEENNRRIHPEDKSKQQAIFNDIFEGRKTKGEVVCRYRSDDGPGGYRYYESQMIGVKNSIGETVCINGTQKDVTSEYLRSQLQQLQQQKLEFVIQNSDIVIWEFDVETQMFTAYNDPINAYDDSVQLTMEEYYECLHPDDRKQAAEFLNSMLAGEEASSSFDVRLQVAVEAKWRYCTISGLPFIRKADGSVTKYVGYRRDNTRWVHLNQQLEANITKANLAIRASKILPWDYDVERGVFITRDSDDLDIVRELHMQDYIDATHPDDRAKAASAWEVMLQGRNESFEVELRFRYKNHPEDGWQFGLVIGVPYEFDENGRVRRFTGFSRNDTEQKRINEELQLSLDRVKGAARISNIVIWEYNTESQYFVSYNEPLLDYNEHQRFSLDEVAAYVHPYDRDKYIQAAEVLKRRINTDISVDVRIRQSEAEDWQYSTISGMPLKVGADGKVLRYAGTRVDNTSWKRMNEQLREKNLQLDMALKAGNIVPITWEIDSEMVYVSSPEIKKKYSVFDTTQDGLPIDVLLNYVHPDDRERVQRIFTDIRSRCRTTITEQFRYDIHGEFKEYFEANFIAVEDEAENYHQVFGYMQNITERKKLLEDLQQAKELAEQSDKLKSAFLANMSHEIRTPLNAIVGFSSLLTETSDLEEQAEYVRIITLNNDLLLRLISDILDLSKIEAGVIDRSPERINLATISHDIYTVMQAKLESVDVTLCLESPYQECWVELDPHRLRQVWNNFLTNAMKHTKHGHITMGYIYTGSVIRVYVEDTGGGIRLELQDRVFGRFQKLNEFEQGTGLGLAICKAIIGAAGGKVGFTSKEGEGSTFWAEIPCEAQITPKGSASVAVSPVLAADTPDADRHTLAGTSQAVGQEGREEFVPHILVAEDNDSNYLLVEHLLKACRLTRACNGVQAVELERNGHFDLVLMDMRMPLMGGLEATRNIRKRNVVLPIVGLTANAFDSDRMAAFDAGCNDFIVKPLKRKELMRIIEEYCKPNQ